MSNQHTPGFSPVGKAAWLERVEKDLRGRPLSDLDWQLEESIRVAPIYTAEDVEPTLPPLTGGRSTNRWEIGAYIEAGDPKTVNQQALEALAGGVTAPLFHLLHQPTVSEIGEILEGIRLDYISLNTALIHPDKDPAELFRDLVYYLRRSNYNLSAIRGTVDFDPFLDWSDPPYPPLVRLLGFVSKYMPHFRVLQVNGRTFHTGPGHTSEELALLVSKGTAYLRQVAHHGADPAVVNRHLQFTMAMSASYFTDIAKLRALKLLWANVLNGFGLKNQPLPPISTHQSLDSQTQDTNANMIRATTQTMAAAIGGASQIYVLPADVTGNTGAKSSAFTRRIARNVQHLLQLESHLDWVADPAAGSYFIEKLTDALAEAAWSQFQHIEAQGGFVEVVEL